MTMVVFCCPYIDFAEDGGLNNIATDRSDLYRRSNRYVSLCIPSIFARAPHLPLNPGPGLILSLMLYQFSIVIQVT